MSKLFDELIEVLTPYASEINSHEESIGSHAESIDDIQNDIDGIKDDLGDKSNLNTDDKSNFVNAINEVYGLFTTPTDEAVSNWLEAHPEATTTVQDGSLTETKFSNALKLKAIKDYVTPQMYGAVGDGVTNDTEAIQSAINSGKNVYFPKAIYVSDRIVIRGNNITIDGGGSSLLFGANSGFIISDISHDIEICNFDLHCDYTVDSDATTNVCIGIAGSGDVEFCAYNISIINCKLDGGVMGVSATSVKNLFIERCFFGSFVYKPTDLAGGYGILLQSCINVEILFCSFIMGAYGRHDIYVSVAQNKSTYVSCKNVLVNHCDFNHENLNIDESGYFYSPATQSISVRSSYNTIITNCNFLNVTGAVVYTTSDGNIDGAVFSDCMIDTPVFNNGSAETKFTINFNGTSDNELKAVVSNTTLVNVPANYTGFMTIKKSAVQVRTCKIGATRIQCYEDVMLQISDIITEIPYYFIRFNGDDETKGYCKSITFTGLTGSKYYYSSNSSTSDGFFTYKLKTILEEITTNGNGTVDSNSFTSGVLNFNNAKMISAHSSINNRIVLPYFYNNRYFFKVFKVSDMTLCANETQTLIITYLDLE